MAHLLIVEDDELLRDGLESHFQQAGYQVMTAADGLTALGLLRATPFDGVILDLGLPQVDGMALLRIVRQQQAALPVLILTARDDVQDRIEGLNAGADDYLTKPFNPDELLARVQSMLRRASLPAFSAGQTGEDEPVSSKQPSTSPGDIQLDGATLRAWVQGHAIDLTSREWVLLDLLVKHRGHVISREAVLQAWQAEASEGGGGGTVASNALEVYVHRLRRKLSATRYGVRNIRGLGYMLEQDAP
ncbi:MAG: Virulence transcriptional regulatory protein PhoP [Pseudomonadota bacterium]|jgi:DNA-binding response OmpR family regulator